MSVNTTDVIEYKIVQIIKVSIILIGIDFLGFLTSSPVADIASKPLKKNEKIK